VGVIENMTNEDYHATADISSTTVKTVWKKSLAHWKGQKFTSTAALLIGSALHGILLEPHREIAIKGPKTRRSKAYTEMERDLGPDQVLLTEGEWYMVRAMAKSAMANPAFRKVLEHPDRQNEVSIFVECPSTGLGLKTRFDCRVKEVIYDVKSTIDSSPDGFSKECWKYAYPLQAAFYLYVCKLAQIDVEEFSFLAIEKTAPYVAHQHVVGPELMEWAHEQVLATLRRIADAKQLDDYGTGWGDFTLLEKPKWL